MVAKMTYRDNNGIDTEDKEFRKEFPALFSTSPSSRVSENYQMIHSDDIISKFQEKGLKLVEASQQVARQRDPRHQLHVMRFQPIETPAVFGVNDSVPEIVVMNGHDGRNRLRALAGIFRFICMNGLVVSDADLGSVVRRHFGESNAHDKVMAIMAELPETILKLNGKMLDWTALSLDFDAQRSLAEKLISARKAPEWVNPDMVLEAHREAEDAVDGHRSLWTTFNVAQENLTNFKLEKTGEGRSASLRPLQSAFSGVKTNQELWATAEAYYTAKVEGMTEDEREKLTKARKAAAERTRRAVVKLETVAG